jgi:inorganic triphosphatase YgiF
VEIELKFQVPADRHGAVRSAVATRSARVTRLQALYADTPDRRLAAAGWALRLRREDERWVQTLKGRGDGVASRFEHEVVLPAGSEAPSVDPARHAGSAAGDRLGALVGGADLVEVMRTDVRRTHRRVASGGAVIEIALDEGTLSAGGRRAEVCELEFELVCGPPGALPALAERWVHRHALWWDLRTKAERGQRLAEGVVHARAVKARPSPLGADDDMRVAFESMVRACLEHALPNLAEIADGSGDPEHLHQLRVGLRRLRSVLRVFADWSGDADGARALEAAWRAPFAQLGASRDVDALAASLLPELTALGAPPLAAAVGVHAPAPGAIVRGTELNRLLLRTLAFAMPGAGRAEATAGASGASGASGAADAADPVDAAHASGSAGTGRVAVPLPAAAATPLRRAWRRALGDVEHFERAEPALQHRTRKRLKRLRYAFEFMVPLYPGKAGRRLQRAIAGAGEALGLMNDLHVASVGYQAMVPDEPRAWFALGWLAARRRQATADAAHRLARLAAMPRPWRGQGVPKARAKAAAKPATKSGTKPGAKSGAKPVAKANRQAVRKPSRA